MNIQELLKSYPNINVSVGLDDLNKWLHEILEETLRKSEEKVLADKSKKHCSPKEAAEELDVDLSTLWRWEKKGYLVSIKVGGKKKYLVEDINAILKKGVKL